MEKWQISMTLMELIHGIILLILRITNGIHNLFDLTLRNVTLGVGILFIVAFGVTFYYLRTREGIRWKYPGHLLYGVFYIILSVLIFSFLINLDLAKGPYATGYLVFGILFLTFSAMLGSILIVASYQAK